MLSVKDYYEQPKEHHSINLHDDSAVLNFRQLFILEPLLLIHKDK